MEEFYNGHEILVVDKIDKLNNMSQEEYNDLAVGPQEEFFQRLDSVNQELEYYELGTIDITKKWNWKPGTYDLIKLLIGKKLYLDKKSNGLDNLFKRTKERANYLNYMHRNIDRLEEERYSLKRLGVEKDVDIEVFKEQCNTFVERIVSQCYKAYEMTNGKVLIRPHIHLAGRKTTFYVDVTLHDLKLGIFDGKNNPKSLQEIPLNDINIIFWRNLRTVLSGRPGNMKHEGKIITDINKPNLEFVYIAHSYRDRLNYGNVCFDKYYDDVQLAFKNHNYLELAMILMQWAQYYNIKFSNPYNQPNAAHIGFPKEFSKEYLSIFDKESITSSCSSNLSKSADRNKLKFPDNNIYIKDICSGIGCQLRNVCFKYKDIARANAVMDSDTGAMIEGLIGWITETYITDYYNQAIDEEESTVVSTASLRMNEMVTKIIGSSLNLHRRSYRDDDDRLDYDKVFSSTVGRLYNYYVSLFGANFIYNKEHEYEECENPSVNWCTYTFDFLENINLLEAPKSTMSNADLELAMKQWANINTTERSSE
jgi:hypothetical protein